PPRWPRGLPGSAAGGNLVASPLGMIYSTHIVRYQMIFAAACRGGEGGGIQAHLAGGNDRERPLRRGFAGDGRRRPRAARERASSPALHADQDSVRSSQL